jgi:hypothetical protein
MKRIVKMALALAITATPVLAAEQSPDATRPVKLADSELDQVTAGDGSLLNLPMNVNILLKDITVTVNVSNVPINAAVAIQANALGQAIQNASVTAGQSVTQAQYFVPIH